MTRAPLPAFYDDLDATFAELWRLLADGVAHGRSGFHLPALVTREGFAVVHRDVIDRPRLTGVSNYGLFDRLWVGLLDLAGVWWLIRRKRPDPRPQEIALPVGTPADQDVGC